MSGSTTISDFTELATRLYFCADCSALRVAPSTAAAGSPAAASRISGQKRRCVKISVRSSSIFLVPSVRQLVVDQVELEPLARPEEHHHHAGVGRGDEGILRRQHAGLPVGVGRRREDHLRAVAHDDVAPVLAASRRLSV